MDQALLIAKKNELYTLIKFVADGDSIEFIRDYAREVFDNNDIDETLTCFRNLAKQKKIISGDFSGGIGKEIYERIKREREEEQRRQAEQIYA